MDYTLPVARRTRSREAQHFKDIHMKMRKLKNEPCSSGDKGSKEKGYTPRGLSSKNPLSIDGDEEEEENGFSDARRRGKRKISDLSSDMVSETKSDKARKQRKGQKSSSFSSEDDGPARFLVGVRRTKVKREVVSSSSSSSDSYEEKAMVIKAYLWDKYMEKKKKKDTAFVQKRNRKGDDFHGVNNKKIVKDSEEYRGGKIKYSEEEWKKKHNVNVREDISLDSDDNTSEEDEAEEKEEILTKKKLNNNNPSVKSSEEEKKKKKKKKASGFSAFKILLNSMAKDYTEGRAPAEEEEKKDEPELQLKFSFLPEPLAEPETEVDKLWRECAVSMVSQNVTSPAADIGLDVEEEEGLDFEVRCALGKHQLEFHEELGFVCYYCGDVIVDIKDVVSPFAKNQERRSGYRNYKQSSWAFLSEFGGEGSLKDPRAHAESVWELIPGARQTMFPHQREALEFVWAHIDAGAADMAGGGGGGCIVSHAPGTGKSRLAIALIQAFLRLRPKTARPVIVAPCGVLLSWENEFRKWRLDAPFHNLNSKELTGTENRAVKGARGRESVQVAKLFSWWKGDGVLGLSYRMLEKLAGDSAEWDGDKDREMVRQILLNSPGLLILDEGHIPRNDDSLIWQVVSRVKTQRRVVLSGTPFQNNFDELFNTMQVARPGIARRCEWRGLSRDPSEIKKLIDPFVHVHGGDVLQSRLPGIRESVVLLRPTPLQLSLARRIPPSPRDPLRRERAESLISVHPSLALALALPGFPPRPEARQLEAMRGRHTEGVKTRFTVELVRMCCAAGERVLVFSQYLEPLSLVAEQLRAEFGWGGDSGEVLCIEGRVGPRERQRAMERFNSGGGGARVMLVSTRAGGEGISLVGASRVVMLDTVWNPSVERQATRRAYRLGQTRFVHVYHLLAAGTLEEDKYRRQLAKTKLSDLVFSPSQPVVGDGPPSEDALLDQMLRHEKLKDIFVSVTEKRI